MALVIGRQQATEDLERAYSTDGPALVSVIGRRRIGKTYLIQNVYADRIAFSVTGLQGASKRTQLAAFYQQVARTFPTRDAPPTTGDWLVALGYLAARLDRVLADTPDKCVVFFDELPWLASAKSGFLMAFGWFWNSWAANRAVVVVICGSAASWMIRKVVRDRGSLHNRITHRIVLQPFTLQETELYLQYRGVRLERFQQLMLYMALGGVPFYLEQVRSGESAVAAIQRLLFDRSGPLRDEFHLLYASLFDDSGEHVRLIRALATKRRGLTRAELLKTKTIKSGGTLTLRLEELALSGFIELYRPFGKRTKDALYRVIDEFSVFHLQFIDGQSAAGGESFLRLYDSPAFTSWAGFSFESVCMQHADQIKTALGIAGIHASTAGYVARARDGVEGVQVDILFDRPDQAITLIEAKYSQDEYALTKAYAAPPREKVSRFRQHTSTKKQLFLALITTFGLRQNQYSIGLVDDVVALDDLYDRKTPPAA